MANETATQDLVLRCQMESYMECGTGDSAKYHLIGEGFTNLTEAKNPKEYARKYVSYKTEKTDVIGYSPSISYTCECVTNDPCVKEIVEITDNEYTGTDARRKVVSVNCWEAASAEGEYVAFMREYAVIPDSKGEGTDALIYSGTMKAVSEKVKGTFNRTTMTFTPDA